MTLSIDSPLPPVWDHNAWADRYRAMGYNVMPADTKNKKTYEKWSQWQDKQIPQEQHDEWKRTGAFNKGMAIMAGYIWRGEHTGKYLTFIDCDNQIAIDEFCTRNGNKVPLKEIAEKFVVEQHTDIPNKCHIYFYSKIPFIGKSSDNGKPGFDPEKLPAFEIKGLGGHGLAYCTPSIHPSNFRYEILGTTIEPQTINERQATEMMQHLDSICKRYSLNYLDSVNVRTGKSSTPTKVLFQEGTKIYEGHSRHGALLQIMDSLIKRLHDIFTENEIWVLCYQWNQEHCIPPLNDVEFEKQWKQASKWIAKKVQEEKQQKQQQQMMIGSSRKWIKKGGKW